MTTTKFGFAISSVAVAVAAAALSLQGQTLPITNGLQLWLKADAGVQTNAAGLVTNWLDQSGNGNNAAPTNGSTTYSPTYLPNNQNGLPTLRYPGGKIALDVPDISVSPTSTISSLTNNVTIIVLKEDDNYSTYRAGVSKTLGNAPGPFDFYNNASASAGDTSFLLRHGTANPGYVGNSFKPQAGVYQVLSFTYANGGLTHYINDAVAAYFPAAMQLNGSPASIWSANDQGGVLRIGSREDFVTQLVGNMAEVLIYQPQLTTAQLMNVVTNYLKPKWGLVFDPPPVVSITSPTNGATFAASALIPVSISASSPTGIVTTVSLYANGLSVASPGTATPPYNLDISSTTPGVLTLLAVATDQVGRPTTSAPVNITITGPAVSAPPANGLAVWLNAGFGVTTNADGTVASWSDESTNGNTATQTNNLPYNSFLGTTFATVSPLFQTNIVNGQPVLHFNGTNSLLTVADTGTAFLAGDFTAFVVGRFSQAYFSIPQMFWSKASNTTACPFDEQFPAGQTEVFRGNGAVGNGAIESIASTAIPLNQFMNLGVVCQGTTVTMYSGDNAYDTGTIAFGAGDGSGSFPLTIGMRDDGAAALYGDIAEILIYSGAQPASNLVAIASYLNGKYGLGQAAYASPSPTVSITSPTNGAVLAAPFTLTGAVAASSSLSFITSVALYANGAKVANFTNTPYTVPLDLLTPGTVTFTAIATDNWGIQSTSAPVVVTMTGTVSAPPYTNGLGIWLKPDAGIVTNTAGNVIEWDDQSGNLNTAYQPSVYGVTPGIPPLLIPNALNGFPVVRFTPPTNEASSNVFLDIADNFNVTPFAATSLAIFAVTRVPAYNNYYEILSDCNPNSVGYAGPFEYRLNTGTGLAQYVLGSGSANGPDVGAAIAPPASSNQFNIAGVVVANGAITHYLDFNTNGSATFAYSPSELGNPIRVGGRGANNGTIYTMNGDIAEIQVFTNTLDNLQIAEIFNYLSAKYALAQVQIAAAPPAITVSTLTNAVSPSFTNFTAPGVLNIGAQITSTAPLSYVTFTVNGQLIATLTSPPYQIPLNILSPGILTISVLASDIYGIASNSVFTLTIPAKPGSVPTAPPTNGMVLWLKADAGVTTFADGTLASWDDQSGNTNNAIVDQNGAVSPSLMTDPVIGVPVVAYNVPVGTHMCLDVADAPSIELTGDMSLFYAVEFTNFAQAPSIYSAIVAKTFSNEPYPFDYYVQVAAAHYLRGLPGSGNSSIPTSNPIPTGQYVVGGVTVATSLVTHYLNSIPNGTGSLGYAGGDGGAALKVGSRDDFVTQFGGNMGEILLYNRGLTGSDLQTANTYLAGRYEIVLFQLAAQSPTLSIIQQGGSAVELAWPPGYSGWTLESSTNLVNWSAITSNPANNQVAVSATNKATFYRLQIQ